ALPPELRLLPVGRPVQDPNRRDPRRSVARLHLQQHAPRRVTSGRDPLPSTSGEGVFGVLRLDMQQSRPLGSPACFTPPPPPPRPPSPLRRWTPSRLLAAPSATTSMASGSSPTRAPPSRRGSRSLRPRWPTSSTGPRL